MAQYLYGAAVQGIQSFIFQTNKLRDIAGASELVNKICTTLFKEVAGENGYEKIVMAAGNIKVIFSDKTVLEKVVREFPMEAMLMAPGITISQAVVEYDGDYAVKSLELEDLLRQERNRYVQPTVSFSAIERSRTTGLPAVAQKSNEWLDAATNAKRKVYDNEFFALPQKSFGISYEQCKKQVETEFKDISTSKSWLAVIHADGNGLGQLVQTIGNCIEKMRDFSTILDEINTAAAQEAFNKMIEEKHFEVDDIIPIRPIVLGGDDFTAVCRADFAIEYVKAYISAFERLSSERLTEDLAKADMQKISICAGVAFIKDTYPFHYGYALAEELCSVAKKDAKSLASEQYLAESCIMFHKVQSSFIEDFDAIKQKELTTIDGRSYVFGPYYVNKQSNRDTCEILIDQAKQLASNNKEMNKIKSHIRQWLTIMADNGSDAAYQKSERVLSLLKEKSNERNLFENAIQQEMRDGKICYRAYDLLSLASVSIK
jgi:hypothetical protein